MDAKGTVGVNVAPKRIHVMHVVLNLDPGGLENGVVNVVNGLDEREFISTVCCLQYAGAFANRVHKRTTVFEMGHTTGNDLLLPVRLAAHIRRLRPDIVHTRNPEPYLYGFPAAILGGVKAIVHSEHGRSFPERPLRRWVQRQFSRRTDLIFSLSQDLRKSLIKHIGIAPEKIEVLYNGVDLDKFRTTHARDVRQRLNIDGKLVVGAVGRLVPVKNYALLIEAVYQLRQRFDVFLMLVGEGPERVNLEALVAQRELQQRVVFLGHQDNVQDFVGAMDIFVLPSHDEGMSNTLIEALAAGVPCIASRVGGNPEVIRHRQDGLLFDSNDLRALVEHLVLLCENPQLRGRIAASGRTRVEEDFSLQTMLVNYQNMYKRALHL